MTDRYRSGKLFKASLYHFIFFLAFIPGMISAQTLVFVETFGNTAPGACDRGTLANGFVTPNGTWTVSSLGIQDSAANEWYISATETGLVAGSCAVSGCLTNLAYTNRTLHVGNVTNSPNATVICPMGDCGAIYDPGGFQNAVQTNKRAESPAFTITGQGVNYLEFNYIALGDSPTDSDFVGIYFFDGTSWSVQIAAASPTAACGPSVRWEKYQVNLPPAPASSNAKIGFLWQNDNGGVGINPSFAVDSIAIYNLIIPVADITVSDTDFCVNGCIDYSTVDAGPGASYTWTFNGGTPSTSTLQNPTGICYSGAGTHTADLFVSSPAGAANDNVTITVNPCVPPIAAFTVSDSIFCERSCITFYDQSINGATGWNWLFPGGIPSSSTSPNPPPVCYDTPGSYNVTLIAYNQFGSDTLVKPAYLDVNSCPLPVADFNNSVVQTCPQQCVSFTDNSLNGPITSYQWYFPGAMQDTSSAASPTVCYQYEGLYDAQLIVTNQYGSDTILKYSQVMVEFVQNATVSPDTEMVFGSSYQLNATGGISYSWLPAEGLDSTNIQNPIASPSQTTTYTVTISDASGCTSLRQVTIIVLHDNDYFVPTAFSPNGDGSNDYLFVRGNNFFGVRLTVYDRWGERLFETNNQLIGWDGTFKGEELNPGVYTYVVTINYNDKESVTKSGTITLVR